MDHPHAPAPALDRRTLLGGAAALTAGATFAPLLGGGALASDAPSPEGFAIPAGACSFVPLDPFRLCDTRTSGPDDFRRLNPRLIRVPVAGRGGAPANATAAVLNVTAINRGGPAFVTVYPSATPMPTASNINLAARGQILSNLCTVKLGSNGAVAIYVEGDADFVVDLAGVYVPATGPTRAGRVDIRPSAVRVLDTRNRGIKVYPDHSVRVLLDGYVPAHATAAVVNITVNNSDAPGYFTAYPLGRNRPLASNLNVGAPRQTRAVCAMVKLGNSASDGKKGFAVYSSHGAHVIVDLFGYVTGEGAAVSENGLFVPVAPFRMLDTRQPGQMGRLWPEWTVEFPIPASIRSQAQGVAMNLTTSNTRGPGFLTVYAAGNARPLASNLNPTAERQQLANHVVTKVSMRGIAVYHARGGNVITDLAGYYTGKPVSAPLPPPVNPDPPPPNLPYVLEIPRLNVRAFVFGGYDSNAVVDRGDVWHWPGTGLAGERANMALFAHRTEANALLRYQHHLRGGDDLFLKSNDGRVFHYKMIDDVVTNNQPPNILAASRYWPGPSVSLVSCTNPDKTPTDLKWRLITRFGWIRWYEDR